MSDSIKILVCYHKPDKLFTNKILVPIHAGRALAKKAAENDKQKYLDLEWLDSRMIGDDIGDNISELNPKLSEMTAFYWAWRNYKMLGNPDYFGLMHYRRFLDFSGSLSSNEIALTPELIKNALREETIQNVVLQYDICINERIHYNKNVFAHYAGCHNGRDLSAAAELAYKLYPDYREALDMYLGGHEHFICNLCVMRRDIFMDYAQWMFSILLPLDQFINYTGYDEYQTRALAFISERLTGVYITRMMLEGKLKILELPCMYLIDAKG